MTLVELGWSSFFAQQVQDSESGLKAARVCRQDINQYRLIAETGHLTATLPGRLRHNTDSQADLPTVGDWVLTSTNPRDEAGSVQIERLLQRRTRFSRQKSGDTVDEQVIAANIDTVFIVCGLDHDFNPARIERYLLLSSISGAKPVILLNKVDICRDTTHELNQLKPIAKDTPWHLVSAKEGLGLDTIRNYFNPGTTCVLIGSSGVGKSTIINALLGFERFKTGSVRSTDSRGRHTTTFREMVVLPKNGLIIDTPGLRELQIWSDSSSLQKNFADITEMALQCRFSDCRHDKEPNCAIRSAINNGDLEQNRFERYLKLERELSQLDSRLDDVSRRGKNQDSRYLSTGSHNLPDKEEQE